MVMVIGLADELRNKPVVLSTYALAAHGLLGRVECHESVRRSGKP